MIAAAIVVVFVIAFVRSLRRAYASLIISPIIALLISRSGEEFCYLTILAYVTKLVIVARLYKAR